MLFLCAALAFLGSCKTAEGPSGSVVLQQRDHEEADALLDRINALNEQGKYAEAIPLAVQLREIVEAEKGPGHEGVAACLNVLGGLYTSFGDPEKAEFYLQKSHEAETSYNPEKY